MKLSELNQDEIEVVGEKPLKLSELPTEHVEVVATPPESPKEEIPMLDSAGRGALQYGTLGYSDEGKGLAGAIWEKVKGNPEEFMKLYTAARDEDRAKNRAAAEANPVSYHGAGVAASLLPGLLTGGSATGLALAGGLNALGSSDADLTKGEVLPAAGSTLLGAGLGAAAGKVAQAIPSASKTVSNYLSRKFGGAAENFAERATGATGRQLEKLKPGTGRYLLDKKIVGFGSHPDTIAKRAAAGMKAAGNQIDEALSTISTPLQKSRVVAQIENRIAELKGDPSQAGVVRKLSKILEDIQSPDVADELSAAAAEKIKRGYQAQSNYMKPLSTRANKEAASVYQKEVEALAKEASPETLAKFLQAKKDYGILEPVEDLASFRANQLQQHPVGGLNDMAAGGLGMLKNGDPATAVATAIGRRTLSPRINAAAAKTLDQASKAAEIFSNAVPKTPNVVSATAGNLTSNLGARAVESLVDERPEALGKYAPILKAAKDRGHNALSTTEYLLQQSDPEYQKLMKDRRNGQ